MIAQQIMTIQQAVSTRANSFNFEGSVGLKLNHGCGIHVTMNPGYAGRAELPESLKVLFRPVTVMVPDFQLIM